MWESKRKFRLFLCLWENPHMAFLLIPISIKGGITMGNAKSIRNWSYWNRMILRRRLWTKSTIRSPKRDRKGSTKEWRCTMTRKELSALSWNCHPIRKSLWREKTCERAAYAALFLCPKTCRNTNISSIFRCKTCPTVVQYPQGATKMVGGSPSAEGCVPPTTYEEGDANDDSWRSHCGDRPGCDLLWAWIYNRKQQQDTKITAPVCKPWRSFWLKHLWRTVYR